MAKIGKQYFIDYVQKLHLSTNYEEAFATYNEAINALGYENLLYSYLPRLILDNTPLIELKASVSKDYNLEFLKQYKESHFEQCDYVLQNIVEGGTSTLDWWKDYHNGHLSEEQKQVFHIMRYDYGINNGLSIPLPNGIKGVGGASLFSNEKDQLFNKLKTETHDMLVMISTLFHNHVISNSYEYHAFIAPELSLLNNTEKKALKCLLDGFSVPEIASTIFRSKLYSANIIRNIRLKIGGENIDGKPRITKDQLIHYCGLMQIYNRL